MAESVVILGGGLAGLASAVFLANEGFDVKLFESSPKWGGRAYSYFDRDKNTFFDNGRHVLAGFYENTFEFMKLIGTYDKLKFSSKLELVLCGKNKNLYKLKSGNLPGALSLLSGIFRFKGFTFKDKLKFLKVKKILSGKLFDESELEKLNSDELLNRIGQTGNLKKFFWTPFILAAFNSVPENVSAGLLVKLLKKGTENKKNMSIILGDDNLNGLFVDNSIDFLKRKSVKLFSNLGGSKIIIEGNNIKCITIDSGETVSGDFYISAVPFYSFESLFHPEDYKKHFGKSINLKSSAIISVHLFFNKDLNINDEMIGFTDTAVQWAFLYDKRHLSLVISGADFINGNLTQKENSEIFDICIGDLKSCLKDFDENSISDYKIIKEKRATFLPETGSGRYRFNQKCGINNLLIAGDWTDTGLPSTIEGAVKSAKICSDIILNENRHRN